MCATSCLALLLPAVGVVPFPKQLSGINTPLPPTNPSTIDAFGNQNPTANAMPGLPISASNVAGLPVSPTLSSSNFAGGDAIQGTGNAIPPLNWHRNRIKIRYLGFWHLVAFGADLDRVSGGLERHTNP